jgi:CDGSH-type Zn-finger protein
MACTCGFSTDYPNCNGTHKTVKMVKTKILQKINTIEFNSEDLKAIVLKSISEA